MFTENEDMILPDDFETIEPETDQPQSEEINETEIAEETTENTNEVVDQQETNEETQVVEQPKIKVKYNHEERELTLEEATQLAQKGMNYDKLQEKINTLQSDPALQYLSELATRNNTTVGELVQYWKTQEEQAQLNELIQKNVPEEYAREMIENRKFREQLKAKENEVQQKSKKDAEYMDFLNTFKEVKPEEIPQEVWQRHEEGMPLKYAYMEHERAQLQNQIKILKQNEKNSKRAVVNSVTSHGTADNTADDPFLLGFDSF